MVAKSITAHVVLKQDAKKGEVVPVEIENVRLDCKVGGGEEAKMREEMEAQWRRVRGEEKDDGK